MRRTLTAGTAVSALALVVTSFALPASALGHDGHSRASAAAKATRVATPYAFKNSGFGSRVEGGDLPVDSGKTGYQVIGCTNKAGIRRHNDTASVELPGLGTLKGVSTNNWTEKKGDVYSSWATHDIAKLKLAETQLGSLSINAISTVAHAYHTTTGYKAEASVEVGGITFDPTSGPPVQLALPLPGQPVTVPGVLSIGLGGTTKRANKAGATATADGLIVNLLATHTKVRIGHVGAQLRSGIKQGVFYGISNATKATALNGIVKSGPQPLMLMPCQGTGGKTNSESLASIPVPGLAVGAANVSQRSTQTAKRAFGYEQAKIASINLGGGALVVNAITARVHVLRVGHKVTTSMAGTTIGSVKVNGETYAVPELDGLEIPGLVKVQTNVVKKLKSGLDVVALRLTLLDGTGAVIDLGHAKLSILGSGIKKKK